MVSVRTLLASALVAAAPAAAELGSMSSPDSATAGKTIDVTFVPASFPENFDDFGVAFGLASPGMFYATAAECEGQVCTTAYIGTLLTWQDLYQKVVLGTNVVSKVTIPSSTPAGDYVLVAAEVYNSGASGLTTERYLFQNITIASS